MNLNVTRLADMRAEINRTELTAAGRDLLERAYSAAQKEWRVRRKKQYRAGIEARNEADEELVYRARKEGPKELRKIKTDLEEGRITPQEAEGKMRDFVAEHGRLSGLHRSLIEDDNYLATLVSEPLDKFQEKTDEFQTQEDLRKRFPARAGADRTLGDYVRQVQEQGD
ncbi:hypothetical protein ADK66_03040 [Micromonospora sp. NRRL B-16802]|uniref:hypothetical protein n=1 Tax=Micromonospora sp. NRRL B-16802 TaxID=1415541 RepID=UPI0006ADCFFB|nr:hypothetical protein [Micromonospora sp. NRRL B-16802]KOX14990.1 hypothetical protein ADK66_03040 [Micromonospora sp. NRRL B-16802]